MLVHVRFFLFFFFYTISDASNKCEWKQGICVLVIYSLIYLTLCIIIMRVYANCTRIKKLSIVNNFSLTIKVTSPSPSPLLDNYTLHARIMLPLYRYTPFLINYLTKRNPFKNHKRVIFNTTSVKYLLFQGKERD